MAEFNLYDDVESDVTIYLDDFFDGEAKVVPAPTDFDIEAVVQWVANNVSRLPHLLPFVFSSTEVQSDTTGRTPTDEIELYVYVAAKSTKSNKDTIARKKAERLCMLVRAALSGKRVYSDYTSDGIIQNYTFDQIIVAGGYALYRTEFTIPIQIDLDQITI